MKEKMPQQPSSRTLKPKDPSLVSYYILCFVRVVMVFAPQMGYIHPDEFFQMTEVVAGEEYDLEITRTWEFDLSNPIRSMTIPFFGLKLPFVILRFLSMYTRYFFGFSLRGSYVILVFPRLMMLALSFVNDWSLMKICKAYGLQSHFRLLTLASSYVMLVYSIRTFTNSIEMALCSLLLYIVSECMIHSNTVIYQQEFLDEKYQKAQKIVDKVKLYKLRMSLPSHSLNKCVLMSTLCVAGVFNRPTFILFGLPLVFHWMLRGMGTKLVSFQDFNIRMFTFIASGIPAFIVFILVDSLYYGYITPAELEHFDITMESFVVTPLNFIRYNINPDNTKKHGKHPYYLHMLVNIPLLYNVLGIIAIISFAIMVYRFASNEYTSLPRAQSFVGLMVCAIFFPLGMLSLINHQEPRFLIPITLPLILLHASKLQTGFSASYPFKKPSAIKDFVYKHILCTKASARPLLKMWYTFNVVLTIFYGFLHQAGIYQLATHIHNELTYHPPPNRTLLITSHLYTIPQCLLDFPNTNIMKINPDTGHKYFLQKNFYMHEQGQTDMKELMTRLEIIIESFRLQRYQEHRDKYRPFMVWLAIPSSLSADLNYAFMRWPPMLGIRHSLIKVFYPHLSTEALPRWHGEHLCGINDDVNDVETTCSIYDDDAHNWLAPSRFLKHFSAMAHQFGLALYHVHGYHPGSLEERGIY